MQKNISIWTEESIRTYLQNLAIPANGYWGGEDLKARDNALELLDNDGWAKACKYLKSYVEERLENYDEMFDKKLKHQKETAASWHYEDYREDAMYDIKEDLRKVLIEISEKLSDF